MPNFRDAASSCDVCLDVYRDSNEDKMQHALVPCGHIFCLGCIKKLDSETYSCPTCRTPIEREPLKLYQDASRVVPPSDMLLDMKSNVINACVGLEHHHLGDGHFAERIQDLVELCIPKEEAEDRIITTLDTVLKLVLGYKEARQVAAAESHKLKKNWKPASEEMAVRQQAVIKLLLDDVQRLEHKLEACQRGLSLPPDMLRAKLSAREPPLPPPQPYFGTMSPIAAGAIYFSGPPPGQGANLAKHIASPNHARQTREERLQLYQEQAADILHEEQARAESRKHGGERSNNMLMLQPESIAPATAQTQLQPRRSYSHIPTGIEARGAPARAPFQEPAPERTQAQTGLGLETGMA